MIADFYNPVWTPDGIPLHAEKGHDRVLYWNDACWNRCVPASVVGLTYLDVGFYQGGYLLRFQQRGGKATGYEPQKECWVDDSAERNDFIGQEYEDPKANALRDLWFPLNGGYRMKYGGFSSTGQIVPVGKPFNIVSSFNVIEYMKDTRACVESLFENALDRVLIATDTAPETCDPNTPPLRFRTSVKDLLSWCPWPCVYWEFDGGPIHGPQVFLCATNPNYSLPEVDSSEVTFDETLEKTETQRFYENRT